MASGVRITMTKRQLQSAFGQQLVTLLRRISGDGELCIRDVEELHRLLRTQPGDMPSVPFLTKLTTGILVDGVIDPFEAYDLRRAIERVLPKHIREPVAASLIGIEKPEPPEESWEVSGRREPATERQLAFIHDLGGRAPAGLSKWEASELIDDLKTRRLPSPRQVMVLRFWNQMDLVRTSRDRVSDWMDTFYVRDFRRERAWELYKVETADDGSRKDPESEPIGIGWEYLRRVQGHGKRGKSGKVIALSIAAVCVVGALLLLRVLQNNLGN